MQCDAISFELNNADIDMNDQAKHGTRCSEDYVFIEGSNQAGTGNLIDRYCGGMLNNWGDDNVNDAKIKDCTAPFEVGIVTDATMDTTALNAAKIGYGSGVCLEYTQEPCAAGNQGD